MGKKRRGANRRSKKPTGIIQSVTLGEGVSIDSIPFPDSKREIEKIIIDAFDRALDAERRKKYDVQIIRQIADENDLDCELIGNGVSRRMDLAEIVPQNLGKGGHLTASGARIAGDVEGRVVRIIREKAKHYGGFDPLPWLLLYPTAWQFELSINEMNLVKQSLIDEPPSLDCIFFLTPSPGGGGHLSQLYPVAEDEAINLRSMNVADVRALIEVTADLSKVIKGNTTGDRQTFVIRLGRFGVDF